MEEKKETFTYTYSAREQEEIRKIREKYAPTAKEETAMERLRRLDGSAAKGATAVSLIVGILSTLILGIGMSCVMVWGNKLFIPGIVIGMIGIVGVIAAYPVYTRMVRRRRATPAPEILRLTEELMK